MASPHDAHAHSDYVPGEMPIQEQAATFNGVMGMFKWGSLATAAFMVLLVFWFCTPAGFLPGLIVGVILLVLGAVFLREKKTAAAH